MRVEIGDKITALGYTFEIARIMYQDYYQGENSAGSVHKPTCDTHKLFCGQHSYSNAGRDECLAKMEPA